MANKIITVNFSSNGVPQTGLTPVIDIWELDPLLPLVNTQVVTNGATVEIGGGWYRYDFTTYNATKNYIFTVDGGPSLQACERYQHGGNESYVEEISFQVWEESLLNHVTTGTTGEALTFIRATELLIYTLVQTLLKYERNRTKIDVANAQMIIYDDDCVTPLTIFNLKDFNGMPSVQEVCERSPTTCP
jgi:hypothetical protein